MIMARTSRINAPGALHYIIVCGIERWSIFVDAQDYQNFLELSFSFRRQKSDQKRPEFRVGFNNFRHLLF